MLNNVFNRILTSHPFKQKFTIDLEAHHQINYTQKLGKFLDIPIKR